MNLPRPFLILLLTANLGAVQAQENAKPPAATVPAQQEMLDWLATNDAPWQAAYQREVADLHDAEVTKLKGQYQTALEAAVAKASSANDLKGALALRDEQKRFAEASVFPYQDQAGEAAAVKQIRAPFRVQFDRVEKDAAARAKALHAKYDQALAQAQAQLTQKQRLDDAVLVQKKREEIAAAWLRAGVGAAPAAGAPADDLLAKLTRTSWSWETVKGKNAISFARDGTFVFRGGTGVFQMEGNVVTVQLANRPHVLTFDFDKGEYTGYDPLLKQVITGHRTAPAAATPPPAAATAKVMATPAPATPAPKAGATPETKSAFDDAQMQKLTRGAWTWETPTAKSTIKFAKGGICVHTVFNGTFELRKDNTVVVHMANGRDEILIFDFNKGDYSGYDAVLKQKITGKRIK